MSDKISKEWGRYKSVPIDKPKELLEKQTFVKAMWKKLALVQEKGVEEKEVRKYIKELRESVLKQPSSVEIMERVKESLKRIDGVRAEIVRTFVGHSLILMQAVDGMAATSLLELNASLITYSTNL